MSKRITIKRAEALMDEIIQEYGADHVVHACQYVVDGKPYCLIGVLMDKLGVSRSLLHKEEEMSARTVIQRFFPATTAQVTEALYTAQVLQDRQHPWGVAYEGFKRVMHGQSFDEVHRFFGYPKDYFSPDHEVA